MSVALALMHIKISLANCVIKSFREYVCFYSECAELLAMLLWQKNPLLQRERCEHSVLLGRSSLVKSAASACNPPTSKCLGCEWPHTYYLSDYTSDDKILLSTNDYLAL